MAKHEKFAFKTLKEIEDKVASLGLDIQFQEDLSPLWRPVTIGGITAPNSLSIHPMEGCDGSADGSPDDLTRRRYDRFARGGAGLLWFEATAVAPEGRANPRQLWIHEGNVAAFRSLLSASLRAARESVGATHRPFTVLQLTHSGRYCKPEGRPSPVIPQHDPLLDPTVGITDAHAVVSDDYLERLENAYVTAARLAWQAGFDAVDVKSCHRYLLSELLAAHTRPGRFGGTFENRTRLLREVVARIRQDVPDLRVAVRMNAYDGHPYPYGWGVSQRDPAVPDLSEAKRLVSLLRQAGVCLVNVTTGNPYFNAHVTRPLDRQIKGVPLPAEHPLEGVARMFGVVREIQQSEPDMPVVGSGYSWLRQFFPQAAASNLSKGRVSLVGLGRLAFAYPNFPRDLRDRGVLDPRAVCIACSKCTQLMRDGGMAGCVVRDAEVYAPLYRRYSMA